jgi:hypothetical protein
MGILLRSGVLEIDKMSFEGMVKLYTETKSLTSFTRIRRSGATRPNIDELVARFHGCFLVI